MESFHKAVKIDANELNDEYRHSCELALKALEDKLKGEYEEVQEVVYAVMPDQKTVTDFLEVPPEECLMYIRNMKLRPDTVPTIAALRRALIIKIENLRGE